MCDSRPSAARSGHAAVPCVAGYGRADEKDPTMDTLQVDQPGEGVTRITLDRPERLNAMNATLIADLHEALEGIAIDRACRVVVLTGAGRGFCAGIDLAGYGDAPGSPDLDRVGA